MVCCELTDTVELIAIDALGASHYADEEDTDETDNNSAASMLTDIVRGVLRLGRIWVATAEVALFDAIRVSAATSSHSAQNENAPRCPRRFMPAAWMQLVSHTVVLYGAGGDGGDEADEFDAEVNEITLEGDVKDDEEGSSRRGVLVLHHGSIANRKDEEAAIMLVAGELCIDETSVALRVHHHASERT